MKKEKNIQNKKKNNVGVKVMALVLALMMVIATAGSLIYALIYA